jgi:dTMP kinase
MADKNDELVLVVPSKIIFEKEKWQGLKTDNLNYYLDLITDNCQFKRRGDVENNPSFKQIIPYILFSFENRFFAYKYLANAGEQRLVNNNYQLGIGGHINREDINRGGNVLEDGMMREWEEEVDFKGNLISKKLVGIVNDDSMPVEQVHLGLVYHFAGDNPDIHIKETDKMEGKLLDIKDLSADKINHSIWMQIVYREYLSKIKNSHMQKNIHPGKFIVVEGLDGSGKSAQVDLIVEYFRKQGKEVVLTKEPTTDSEAGRKVKQALKKEIYVEPLELQGLYVQDRKEHLENKVIPALREGKVVVSSRYAFSTFAYGYSDGLDVDELVKINEQFLLPDLTVIVDVSPESCVQRIEGRGEPKELFEQLEKLKKVNEIYKKIPEMFENVVMVNGEKKIAKVFEEIKKIINEKFFMEEKMETKRRIYTLPNNLTPEIKAVTFAKCSRSAESFDKIAAELTEEKSSEFNEKWVVGFGHSSIAEHAVISLAIENVSNIATKVLEDSRLASFTEKSSRYQIFSKEKLYMPEVVANSELKQIYLDAVNALMDAYEEMTPAMMEFVKQKYLKPADQDEKLYNMISKARACDNLRYLLPSAVLTNLGMTINTRELEHLISKLLSHPLQEMQDIGKEIKETAMKDVPTLLKFANKNDYVVETKQQLKNIAQWELGKDSGNNQAVTIVDYDKDATDKLITGILYPYSDLSYEEIARKVRGLSEEKKEKIIDETLKRRKTYDQPLRELEHIYYTFDILMDYGAFRDVQRHRMCTQSNQPITVVHGYDLPPEIREAGFEEKFKAVVEKSVDAYNKIFEKFPEEAQYVVPMCFRKRVLITWNLRELHHFIALRSGKKGHASYRRIAQQCWRELNKIQPLLAKYIRVDMDEMSVSWAASLENKDYYYNPHAARAKQ